MADRAKDRPFYQLPLNYKSCSTIIQETRRQLGSKSLERAGSSGSNPSSRENSAGATSSSTRHGDHRSTFAEDGFDDAQGSNSHARPVYTQRPKTGIEHDMSTFWGVSSRKRPPSAITLSRLSLMDSSSEDDTSAVQNLSSQVGKLELEPNDVIREEAPPPVKLEKAISDLKSCFGKTPKAELIEALKNVDQEVGYEAAEPKLKPKLLKLVFKLVEKYQQDEDILFWASSILMKCKVEGSTNLTTVFKLVFKASRSKAYWTCMVESDYLDSFMCCFAEVNAVAQIESLIYGYGTLKFLCVDKAILEKLLSLGLVRVMTFHLKSLNVGCKKEAGERSGDVLNGVFQLTSILRSVVGEESTLGQVVESGLLMELLESLTWTLEDIDVLSNIVRILSVVSGSALCCDCISASRSFPASVIQVLDLWYSKEDVVVRLCYCLGNVLAVSDRMRLVLDQKKTGPSFLSKLIKVIHYYLERFNSPSSEDVLIKSIRVLANWSLNPMIGTEVGESANVMDLLNVVLKNSDQQFSDELLMCAVGTLNNVSYYKDFEQMDSRCVLTSQYLLGYVNSWSNEEGVVEALRVLGNLTRNPSVREVVAEHVGVIVRHLEKKLEQDECPETNEATGATLGLLMNVIVVEGALKAFGEYGGMALVVKVFEGRDEVGVHLMGCQFLWNFIMASMGVGGGEGDGGGGGGGGGAVKGWGQETRLKLHTVLGQRLDRFNDDNKQGRDQTGEIEEGYFDVGGEFQVIGRKVWERLALDLEEEENGGKTK